MNTNIYTIKILPTLTGFHDFIRYYRSLYNTTLIEPNPNCHDPTISHVLAIRSQDQISSLPQRLILTSFLNDSPIISYGCICFCFKETKEDGQNEPYFLLVKRENSVSYCDFLLGHYRTSQLFLLIRDLSNQERERLISYDFETLWDDLQSANSSSSTDSVNSLTSNKEMSQSNIKGSESNKESLYYEYAKRQYLHIRPHLKELFEKVPSCDPTGKGMWGFPKGKPIVLNPEVLGTKIEVNALKFESALNCAFREFKEETNGISLEKSSPILPDPISELYTGTNNKNYQTHYFAVQLSEFCEPVQFPQHATSIRLVSNNESSEIKWVPLSELNHYLREHRVKLCEYIFVKGLCPENKGLCPEKKEESFENKSFCEEKLEKREKIEFNPIWSNSIIIADEFTPTYD